jgi:hypothetical protein
MAGSRHPLIEQEEDAHGADKDAGEHEKIPFPIFLEVARLGAHQRDDEHEEIADEDNPVKRHFTFGRRGTDALKPFQDTTMAAGEQWKRDGLIFGSGRVHLEKREVPWDYSMR